MPAVGMTFSPLNAPMGQQGSGQGGSPLQDAIQLLNFKLPAVVGAGAGSGVLGPPTAAGGLSAGLGTGAANSWLMQLLKGIVPDAGQQGAPGGPPRPAVQFPQANTPQQSPGPGSIPGAPDIQSMLGGPNMPFTYMHG